MTQSVASVALSLLTTLSRSVPSISCYQWYRHHIIGLARYSNSIKRSMASLKLMELYEDDRS